MRICLNLEAGSFGPFVFTPHLGKAEKELLRLGVRILGLGYGNGFLG